MARHFGRKQSFGQKLKGTLRRIFTLSVLGGTFIGAPAYYEYGTVNTQEVKIKDVKSDYVRYDRTKHEAVYNYKVVTDQGMVFENNNSLLHLKFNSKNIQDQLNEGREAYAQATRPHKLGFLDGLFLDDDFLPKHPPPAKPPADDPANKVYRISYYGARIDIPFIHTYPNLLSVQEVSKEELQARALAEQDARAKVARQSQIQSGQPASSSPQQQNKSPAGGAALTPEAVIADETMVTFSTVVDGERVSITAPIEAAGKITVNKVTPLVPKSPTI